MNTSELKSELLRRGTAVDSLRKRIYANGVASAPDGCWADLARAENALQSAADQLAGAHDKSAAGIVLKASDAPPTTLGAATTGISVNAKLRMERIPTSVVNLLNAVTHPLITYEIENSAPRTRRLQLSTWVEGYSASAVDTIEIPPGQKQQVSQLVTFFPDRLRQVTELTRATLHAQVEDLDGARETHSSRPIWLLARESAYLSVLDPSSGEYLDLTQYLAAWVTPHVEPVLQVLREAADMHPGVVMAGYQGDRVFVELQARAIFEALKARKIAYINSVICFGEGMGEFMQRIRLPRESLATRSANCVDGAVLFSSMLEAASINPALVLVPGHAFVGWQVQEQGEWDYLETTMIGTRTFEEAQDTGCALARAHGNLAAGGKPLLSRLSLAEARSQNRVTPME